MTASVKCLTVLLTLSVLAFAEDKPKIAVFPVQFVKTPKKAKASDRDTLSSTFRKLLVEAGGQLPEFGSAKGSVSDLKNQDCFRNDECLAQLANLSSAPYGLYVELDYTEKDEALASGRVVQEDGKRIRDIVTVRVLKAPSESYLEVSTRALRQFVEGLNISTLSPLGQTTKAVEAQATAKGQTAPTPLLPPPMPALAETKTVRNSPVPTIPVSLMVGGGVVALAGGILWGVGVSQAGSLKVKDGVLPAGSNETESGNTVTASRGMQTAGAVALGVGAIAATSGLIWWLTQERDTASTPAMTIGIAPTGNGGMASIQGRF
jgi:hypothetical protein